MNKINANLALMLATITPREVLIEDLKESIAEFEEAKLLNKSEKEQEELFKALAVKCHFITINVMTKGSLEGVHDMMRRMDELQRQDDFFNKTKTNTN